MFDLNDALQSILNQPTPETLIGLQGALLVAGEEGEVWERAVEVTGQFFHYLSDLKSKLTARNYSELASMLDVGAVGAVALGNIANGEPGSLWRRLFVGGLAEGLMVAASRQYVKGWGAETGVVHSQAAWTLAGALWRVSSEMQPELPHEQRWEAIQALLAPAHDPDVPAPEKAMLLGRIFQILLVTYLARLSPTQ